MELFLLSVIVGLLIGRFIPAPRWLDRLIDRQLDWEDRRRSRRAR